MVAPSITGTITPIGTRYLDTTTGNNLASAPSYPSVATCGFTTSTTSPLLGTGRQSTFTQAGSWTVARWEGGGWDISPSINGTGGLFCGHIAPAQNNGRFTLARIALRSGAGNWRAWQVWDNATFSTDNYPHKFSGNFFPFVIDAASTGSYSDVGTFNITAIDRIEVHYWVTSSATYSTSQDEFVFLKDITISQGDSGNIATLGALANNTLGTNTMLFNTQGSGYYYSYFPVNFNPDYFQQTFTLRYPSSVLSCYYTNTSFTASIANTSGSTFDVKDSILQSNGPVVLSTSLNASSTRNFNRLIISTVGGSTTFGANYTQTGGTFSGRGRIDCLGTLSNVLIANSSATNGALLLRNTATISNCTFSGNAVALSFAASGNYNISSLTFTSNTIDLLADGVNVTVTVTSAQSLSLTKSEINGGSITFVAPSVTVTIPSLVAGTRLKIYNTGTTTLIAGTNSSGTSFSWTNGIAGQGYDIYAVLPGYGSLFISNYIYPSGSASLPIDQKLDPNYAVTSGLTLTLTGTGLGASSDIYLNTATKQITVASGFGINAVTGLSMQALYSFIIESRYANDSLMPFHDPVVAISFAAGEYELRRGWKFQGTSTTNLMRDGGARCYAANDIDITERYINITGLGTLASSATAYYWQINSTSATFTNAVTPGQPNQLIKVFGDASNGNFDYRNFLKVSIRAQGQLPVTYDLISEQNISQLRSQRYFIPLSTRIDPNIVTADSGIDANSDGVADVAPFNGMSLTWYGSNQTRVIDGVSCNFNIIGNGNGANKTRIREFLNWAQRQSVDIDSGAGNRTGRLVPDLYTNRGDILVLAQGLYFDNFDNVDQLKIIPTDVNGVERPFPAPLPRITVTGFPNGSNVSVKQAGRSLDAVYNVNSPYTYQTLVGQAPAYIVVVSKQGYEAQEITVTPNGEDQTVPVALPLENSGDTYNIALGKFQGLMIKDSGFLRVLTAAQATAGLKDEAGEIPKQLWLLSSYKTQWNTVVATISPTPTTLEVNAWVGYLATSGFSTISFNSAGEVA